MSDVNSSYDIVIVGGGLVGMSLAIALAKSPCSVLLLEQNQAAPVHDNVLDLRTTGLTRSSEQVFKQSGIWGFLATAATPIEKLDISEQGNFGVARIDAKQHGVSPIGYMMPNHHLTKTLSEQVSKQPNVRVLSPAALTAAEQIANGYRIKIDYQEKQFSIQTSLLVGSDGGNSKTRTLLGIEVKQKSYQQRAIITNVKTQKHHQNVAFERFTQHGPLAVLPVQNNCCALIWTQSEENADHYLQMNDQEFLTSLQKAFGYRLGKFTEVGQRSAYPLSSTTSNELTTSHAVLIGNAAQTVHPVAAQGLNLGLRDVNTLVHMLKEINYDSQQFPQMLLQYPQKRQADRDHVIKITDGLVRIFSPQVWPAKILRSLGMRLISNVPLMQRGMLRRNMGLRYLLSNRVEENG